MYCFSYNKTKSKIMSSFSSSRRIVSYKDFDVECLVVSKLQDTTSLNGDKYLKMTIGYKYGGRNTNKISPLLLEGPELTSERGMYFFPHTVGLKGFRSCASIFATFDPSNDEHDQYIGVVNEIYQVIIDTYMTCNKQLKLKNISYETATGRLRNIINYNSEDKRTTISQTFKCYGSNNEHGECELKTKFFDLSGNPINADRLTKSTLRFIPLVRFDKVSVWNISSIIVKLDECVILSISTSSDSKQLSTIREINDNRVNRKFKFEEEFPTNNKCEKVTLLTAVIVSVVVCCSIMFPVFL